MRLMESIRRHGDKGLKAFLALMFISVFGGLGVGFVGGINGGNKARQNQPAATAPVVDPTLGDTALTVNGHKVTNAEFNDEFAQVKARMEMQMQQQAQQQQQPAQSIDSNPQSRLAVYGITASRLVQEQVLLDEAKRLNVKVEDKDIKEERDSILKQIAEPAKEDKTTGNAIRDLTQKFGSQREQKSQFEKYLERTGVSEMEWYTQTTRQLLQTKARDAMQEEVNKVKDAKAKETQALIDEELKKGTSFADLATKYSDQAESAKFGGDMQQWLKPGLLPDSKNDDILFSTKKGEMTPWFDVDAGYQRWEVYDVKDPSGPEFEAEKPGIITKLKADKGESYTPSDEEIAKQYHAVKARQIMLNKTDSKSMQEKLTKLIKSAKVEINNTYALAYQALYDEKIQPPSTMSYESLMQMAKDNSAATADYDYTLLKGKLERGRNPVVEDEDKDKDKDAAAKPADAKTEGDGKSASASVAVKTALGDKKSDFVTDAAKDVAKDSAEAQKTAEVKPAAAKADGATPADAKAAEAKPADAKAADDKPAEAKAADDKTADAKPAAEENPGAPCYAVAIALLKAAQQDNAKDKQQEGFGLEVVATVYLDWLKNEAELKTQPIDRDKARQEVETLLAQAVKTDNYNGPLYAARGSNLAWLDKKDDADAALQLALKYTPASDNATLTDIKATYDKLEMPDKAKLAQDKIDKARQDALKAQIDQAIAQQQSKDAAAGSAAPTPTTAPKSIPITIPPAGGAPGGPPSAPPPPAIPPGGAK